MLATFGSMPSKMPAGFYKAVNFPVLALLDKATGDHRMLSSDGGRTRELPLTIRTQPAVSSGHDGAIPSGALFEVTFDPEQGVVSGRGFLADDEMGRKTGFYIASKVMNKNSVDVAEVKARFEEDMQSGDYWINFYEWALSATTIVATPAFAEAYAELDTSDEVMAALIGADPMAPIEIEFENPPVITFAGDRVEVEVVADGVPRVPYDAFFIPESPKAHKIRTDGSRLWGHLGKWNTCHDGLPNCTIIPRPLDGYASFNKPGAFTERGQINTGPIFALGGHRTLLGKITDEEKAQAYGGIENAWADVRITEGVHGPWLSGHIRPGVDGNIAFAAIASRISGHWVGGRLKAIVSVNAEGYDLPEEEMAASYIEFGETADGEMELVASFGPCEAEMSVDAAIGPDDLNKIVQAVLAELNGGAATSDEAAQALAVDPTQTIALALLLAGDDD